MERIRTAHPDPFHATPEPAFQAAADELAARADGLSPDQLLVELMRFSCLLGERDGHSGIFPLDSAHKRVLHLFPLYLYKFSDGLFVVAAPGRASRSSARRCSRSTAFPADELERQVRPLVPRDNEATRDDRFMSFLLTAEVLHGLGLRSGTGPAAFTLQRPGAAPQEVTLAPVTASAYLRLMHARFPVVRLRPAEAAAAALPAPSRRGSLRHDDRPRTGRLRRLQHDARLDRPRGADASLRLARQRRVRRVVVDVRLNPGGDNHTYAPLLAPAPLEGRRTGPGGSSC